MVLLTVYLSVLYVVIGVPDWRYITWDPTVNLVPFQDFTPENLRGMALNAAMFAPLGFLLPAYFDRYRSFVPTLDAGILTSLTVELIQLFTFRATDADDLIMNTLGVIVGFLLSKLILGHRPAVYRGKSDWAWLLGLNGMVILVTVFVRYPLAETLQKMVR
ncbi:MAG TPA: hypothetical protein DDY87_02800 [Clostridiales bacterium]|nr:hypothetical protein [Clostridiales bacterium]